MISSQCLAPCLLIGLILLVKVTSIPTPECLHFVNSDGVNVHNCSGRGLDTLPVDLVNTSEILDFSGNRFTELPHIPESDKCNKKCPFQNSSYHCRQHVSFSRNHISSLADNAFHGLRCLRTLDLSFNEIKGSIFHSNTFQNGVYYLQRLFLNNNPLGSIPGNVITQPFLPDLRELDVSHCGLETIDPDSVDDFAELRILNLSYNKLKKIHPDTFKGLDSLEHLDLRENQLTSFPEHIFWDLRNLKVLLLSDNKIQNFHSDSFHRDSNLEVLDLRNNQLTSIPYSSIDKVTKLQTLDLSQNPISQVTQGSILSDVKNLVLDNMPELTELGPYSLASFSALVSLSISGNKALETVDHKFLGDNHASLKRIRLENNKLSTLDSDAVPWKHLEELKIGGNTWYCDDVLQWMINAQCIQEEATCSGPLQLKGHNIKTLHSDDLMYDYSLESATGVIVLFICLPLFGACAVLIWRRRRHCPCVKVTVQGQYITLFTRDMDDEDDQRVSVELKMNTNKLKSVSNGGADDTRPFVRVHRKPSKIVEEPEEDDI